MDTRYKCDKCQPGHMTGVKRLDKVWNSSALVSVARKELIYTMWILWRTMHSSGTNVVYKG